MPDLYPFKSGPMEPIVLPGEMVGVWVNKVYHFYTVDYIEGIPRSDPVEQDFGGLAAGAVSALTQMALLEMPDVEFGQFRSFAIDDAAFDLWQGRSDHRYVLQNANARITRATGRLDPCGHQTEFYVHEDDFAFIAATNTTLYALVTSRMAFYGFRYVCTVAEGYRWNPGKPDHRVPDRWTRVPATAHL